MTSLRVRSGLRFEPLDGKVLVLSHEDGQVYNLSGPAAEAMALARSGASEGDVPDHLAAAMAELVGPASSGTANTGGGGGGFAGDGGSGLVIVAYPTPVAGPTGSGGTFSQSGGTNYHVFTSSGTFTIA